MNTDQTIPAGQPDALWQWMLRFHYDENLKLYTPGMKDGHSPLVDEGDIGQLDRPHKRCRGILIVANGKGLLEDLLEKKIILDAEEIPREVITNYEAFAAYLGRTNGDGAYLADKSKLHEDGVITIGKIPRFVNDLPLTIERRDILSRLPPYLLSFDGRVPVSEAGCKTVLAATFPYCKLPNDHQVETYLVKSTPHSLVGPGAAAHFKQGRMNIFTFEHEPQRKGEYLDPENRIVGVDRSLQNGGPSYSEKERQLVFFDGNTARFERYN